MAKHEQDVNSLNLKLDSANTNIAKKQDASTAITTSNIGKQSVSYATNAGNANTFGGYVNDIGKETNATWVLANYNGKIQHRVIPTNLVTYNWYNGLNAINSIRGGWQSDGSVVLDWMFGVNDCIRILFVPNTGYFCIQKQVSGTWTSLGSTFFKIGG